MEPSHSIAVVGTGVIGASWVSYFLAQGFDVVATDPAAGAEVRLRELVARNWPALQRIGLMPGASIKRLHFEDDLEKAVAGATFIQENGPERIDIKRELFARIDAATDASTLIATSSSGILISDVQDAAKHPERILLGHPFNPPHLIPLVEVVGGKLTSAEAIQRALDFYTSIGKQPIYIRRETPGHIANRLQAALWREAFYLVEQGVASVSDIDKAIANGPGLRWALLGPFMNLHLSGGSGGITHLLEHLGPPIEGWWKDLGEVSLSTALNARFSEGVKDELQERSIEKVNIERDEQLIQLLQIKQSAIYMP